MTEGRGRKTDNRAQMVDSRSYKGNDMDFKFENVVVTGAAGFIGFHLSRRLLNDGTRVTGVDNLNPYYDVQLKGGSAG